MFEKQINPLNPMGFKGEIVRGYANILNDLWGSNIALYPSKFKGLMGKYFD